MKTNLNIDKEIIETNPKDIEGNKSLFFFLYKKINIFYEFSEKKYSHIFFKSVSDFNVIKQSYEKEKSNGDFNFKKKRFEEQNIKNIGIGGYGQVYRLDNNYCVKISINKHNYYHEYYIAKELSQHPELKNSIIDPEILIKTQNFVGLVNFLHINILFIYLTYCYIKNKNVQENEVEQKLATYDITNEYKYLYRNENRKIVNDATNFYNFLFSYFFEEEYYINMLNKFLKILNYFKDFISNKEKKGYMIIMPLADGMSNNIYLNKETMRLDSNGLRSIYVYPYIYRMLFLQVSLFFLNVNKFYSYLHNDLKPDNVLVTEEIKPYTISYNDLTYYFKENFKFKISDFDFSKIIFKEKESNTNIFNKKIENTTLDKKNSWLFDIHFFIHKLMYYIGIKETELDKDFFLKLHEIFIKPYCKISFVDLHSFVKVKNKKTNDVCDKGYIYTDKRPDISILINFLKSDFFSFWMKK